MADTMTNEEILSEFETLFGSSDAPDEESTTVDEEDNDNSEETTEEESTEEEATEGSEEDTGSEDAEEHAEDDPKDKSDAQLDTAAAARQSKQNHAFAEQRLQIKENEKFVRSLGKLIGFNENASISEIQDKVKEVLLEKEAKENGISVELAKRLDIAEELIQENDRIKLEKKVHEDFSELIDKHNLDEEAVNEFTSYLIESGKNPMVDRTVDIESEYLKLHYDDMVKAAVADALAKEEARRQKIEDKAASSVSKGAGEKGEHKVSSVRELDDLFANTDL